MKHKTKLEIIQENIEKTETNSLEKTILLYTELTEIKSSKKSMDSVMLKLMFKEYNYYFSETQNGLWCGSCRQTCFKGLGKTQDMINDKIKERNA